MIAISSDKNENNAGETWKTNKVDILWVSKNNVRYIAEKKHKKAIANTWTA